MSGHPLPQHLKKYVVEQDYAKYTPVDQAIWRYIMRQLKSFLSIHAHESYVSGLEKTGIDIESIPKISDVSDKLSKFGWTAVPVSGFIPPAAFMELQSLSVLPIASDLRSLDHLLYTPAPDIVHEAAGHAPILSNPEFAGYLKKYAQVAKKAIISKEDLDQYEAIRSLSDLKEHPESTPEQIAEAEKELIQVSKNISHISEAAELSRMNWWTAEYGLVGSLDAPKIFGAGLLSSVGESHWCLSDKVKKIPLTIDCIKTAYDITEPQPQLFVTPDFNHLSVVLDQFAETMAFKTGSLKGFNKALQSRAVTTSQLDSGVQISGVMAEAITAADKEITYLRTQGPTQLSYQDKQLMGHDNKYHAQGFGTPVGFLKNFPAVPPHELSDAQWASAGCKFDGATVNLTFSSGVSVKGNLKSRLQKTNHTLLLTFENCEVKYEERVLFEPGWGTFDMALGTKVISVFGGPADREAFGTSEDFMVARVPHAILSEEDKKRHALYQSVRDLRKKKVAETELKNILKNQATVCPDDWLITLEVLEIALRDTPSSLIISECKEHLKQIIKKFPECSEVVKDGLALAGQSLFP